MATATAEKMDTQSRLEAAQAHIEALKAEASGLAEAMQQALRDGDTDRYLQLMAREHAIPRDIEQLETESRELRRQGLQERYEALAAEEPGLRAKHQQAVRRNQEKIKAIQAETDAAASAYFANVNEARAIDQELRTSGVVIA